MISGRLYAKKAISQIPRILSMQDRNEHSPTYGCFDRIYWLDKSIDFPSAILQLNAHNLALVYSHPYSDNPFYKQEKVKKWCFAGMKYWTQIQNDDGSFDEFYPNERGWAGPTGFLLYSMLDSYSLLKEEMPSQLEDELMDSSHKAAKYLAEHDEAGILANHHAMALLPIYYAYTILEDDYLLERFYEKFDFFETLQSNEGWFLEYDGADPGYLSATISFLGKLYKLTNEKQLKSKILEMVEDAIEFSGYFVYPNKYYGGTVGSRQTLHFYPHGYEIFSEEFPLAGRIADEMLEGLSENKLVPPEIMPWRYLGYRVQEYLLAGLDSDRESVDKSIKLPHEKSKFNRFYEDAKMLIVNKPDYYLVSNLAKGGVVKLFGSDGELTYNDCGIVGELEDGNIVTTQWIDEDYKIDFNNGEARVKGNLNFAPYKTQTPLQMMAFRSALLTLGQSTRLSEWMKGVIRDLFITSAEKAPVKFERRIRAEEDSVDVYDVIEMEGSKKLESLWIGDEFSVRYVPQSMYFQSQELGVDGFKLDQDTLEKLNQRRKISFKRTIHPRKNEQNFDECEEGSGGLM